MSPNTFVVVGEGGGSELTPEQRACLLRAARRQLKVLQAELHRLQGLPSKYAGGPIEAAQAELDCLAAAVSWLWSVSVKPP